MRWKTSHHGHDPRHVDLIAMIVLLVAIIAACRLVQGYPTNSTTAFTVSGQTVHW